MNSLKTKYVYKTMEKDEEGYLNKTLYIKEIKDSRIINCRWHVGLLQSAKSCCNIYLFLV